MTIATERLLTGTALEEQIELEREAVREGVIRYRTLAKEAIERGDGASLKPAERLVLHWLNPLIEAIRIEHEDIRAGKSASDRAVYGPALLLLDPERLALITLNNVLGRCMAEPAGVKIASLVYRLGSEVIAEAHADMLRQQKMKVTTKYGERDTNAWTELDRRCKQVTAVRVNRWARKTLTDPLWSMKVCTKVGAYLMWAMIGVAGLPTTDGSFKLAFRYKSYSKGRKRIGMLCAEEQVFGIIESGHELRQLMRPRYLPMIVKPFKWSTDAQGGYVEIRTPFTSKPTGDQRRALAKADLSRIYDGLDAVCEWALRVNRFIAGTQEQLWKSGGAVAGLPRAHDIEVPPPPAGFDRDADDPWKRVDPEARVKWRQEASAVHKANSIERAERRTFIGALNAAKRFAEYPRIWFPHQLDFRGRVYPIPVYLNHQGEDTTRGLLEFADGKPAESDEAKRWLAIHTANTFGNDKLPFNERCEWVEANRGKLASAAADPVGTLDWWSRKPNGDRRKKAFQFLAACRAQVDPEAAAHIPIQLDGTANGLQHYAALGRDPVAAEAVNLVPRAVPGDPYRTVGEATRPIVERDAACGIVAAGVVVALVAADRVSWRDIAKTPTMTTTYGVTDSGARGQMADTLRKAGLPESEIYPVARYLAKVVLMGVGEVCAGARRIMDWLAGSARAICKTGETVAWTTPLGFPVVQPYRDMRLIEIITCQRRVYLAHDDPGTRVATRKQVDGVAPNFIHSIDATHMMMVAAECRKRRIPFASTHDCFWTIAAHAGELSLILREQFVKLHERPILEELYAEWKQRYPKAKLIPPPPPGSFNINHALEATYAFS